MKLRYLKDHELEISFQNAVKTERKIIHIVILHIQEISRRKIYLARGYPSLFEYLVKEAKYSSSAAQRRIEAMRLLTAVPSIADNLQSGDLNLSQIGEIQRAVKEAQKIHQTEVTREVKESLVEMVLNQNQADTQAICAKELNIPVITAELTKTQKDKSRRIEITFTESQFKKYEEVRDKLAHKNFQKKRTQSMADVLETLFEEILKTKSSTDQLQPQTKNETEAQPNSIAAPATECVETTTWKSLTPKRTQTILHKDQCCQYIDHTTGRQCGSKFNLEVDHIQPKWAQGSNQPENLRVLCRAHTSSDTRLSRARKIGLKFLAVSARARR